MNAKAVCLPLRHKPFTYLNPPVVMLIFFFAAMLLLSCNSTPSTENASTLAKPATESQPHDFAYQYSEDAVSPSVNTIPVQSLNALVPLAKSNTKIFAVNTAKDTVVIGNKGIMLHIEKGSFDLADPTANVKIELKEYISTADFFFSGLSTTSNGLLLESGGTVFISATANGKEVKLKDGKTIEVAFPTAKPKPNMQTFYGEKSADGTVNWLPTGNTTIKPFTNYNFYDTVETTDTIDVHLNSTLTKNNFLIQTFDGRYGCLRFDDATQYKNILEYFNDKFTITASELKALNGTVIEFAFIIDRKGKITKVNSDVLLLNKPAGSIEFERKDAIKSVRAKMTTAIKQMPVLYGRFSNEYRGIICGVGGGSKLQFNSTNRLRVFIRENSDKPDYTVYSLDKTVKRQRKYKSQVYNKAKEDSVKNIDARYCFLKSDKLGWINCDRFSDSQIAKTNVHINLKAEASTEVRVIFKDIMSVMNAYYDNGGYIVKDIPIGANVKYIAIQNRTDGIYFAVINGNTNNSNVSGFEFKPMTIQAIKSELASL